MQLLVRLSCWLLFALLLLTSGGYLHARLTGRENSLTTAFRALFAESQRERELSRRDDAVRQVIRAKNEIVREVIASKMSLAEAVAAFRAAHQAHPEAHNPGGLDDAHLAENVLSWVRAEVDTHYGMAETVLPHLEAEMRQLLRKQGPKPTRDSDSSLGPR